MFYACNQNQTTDVIYMKKKEKQKTKQTKNLVLMLQVIGCINAFFFMTKMYLQKSPKV